MYLLEPKLKVSNSLSVSYLGYVGLASIPTSQQSFSHQHHFRDAALMYFHTRSETTKNYMELRLNAHVDEIANKDLHKVHVVKLRQLGFDLKSDKPKKLCAFQKRDQCTYQSANGPEISVLAFTGDGGAGATVDHFYVDKEVAG